MLKGATQQMFNRITVARFINKIKGIESLRCYIEKKIFKTPL